MNIFDDIFQISMENNIAVIGLTNELNAIYIYLYYKKMKKDILIVTNTLFEASKIYDSLCNYTNEVLFFPADDFLTSEAVAISPDLKIIRLNTLNKTIELNQKIVVTHLMGLLHFLPTKTVWSESVINLKVNNEYNMPDLLRKFYNIGYYRETLVSKIGEIGVRGFIIDVFPFNEPNPIRIEFFGDEIESIRYFDIESQRSLKSIDEINICAYDEFITTNFQDDNIQRRQKNLPLVSEKIATIKDYLNEPIIIYKDYNQIKNAYILLREEIHNYHVTRDKETKTNYIYELGDIYSNKNIYLMTINNMPDGIDVDVTQKYDSREIQNFDNKLDEMYKYISNSLNKNKTIVVALNDNLKINEVLNNLDNNYVITDENNIYKNKINIIKKKIDSGFEINNLIVITETDLFKGKREKSKIKKRLNNTLKIKDLNKINIGDYVVHDAHGIGIYMGVTVLLRDGLKKDYILLKYMGNDKLYIPVEKIDLISKFSGLEARMPKINRLDSIEWKKTKLRVRGRIKDIAEKLIALAAEREMAQGYKFSVDTEEQILFEQKFIHEETNDQRKVTEEIKKDLEQSKPMDRLLCGDVGYGKTEVAFRAMFKAISNFKQVAYLCPTTILSKQQYNSALERFSAFPFNIALLNRFTSKKAEKQIIDNLANGKMDIIFGTHKILSDKIKFKNLGLLIIDEEQRFGVMQKEKIRNYKNNINILTLTATPIPRTLQMSMIGLRDLSLIETPPVNRYPIQTYVLPYNIEIIKQAIYKELSRKGQVFVLYNKVDNMLNKVEEIKKIVPEARITYAHGQLPKLDLENRMLSFVNNEYDVLICSTIIETGIDIPNVNALIIINADCFGLSQLYQIRGRVGRSDKIAYAYLMYDDRKVLNENAVKRLNVIKEFTELGSGFAIAARDLSIRGAGDILGSEQAGFIDVIGIDLYLKLLNEEIAKIRGEKIEYNDDTVDEMPLIDVETHIDDAYINEEELKIEIHKKINDINSYQKLITVKDELYDRFGKMPSNLEIYMYQEWFEKLAKRLEIVKVIKTKRSIEMIFSRGISKMINDEKVFEIAYSISNMFSLRYCNNYFSIILNISRLEKHYIYYVAHLLEQIEENLFNKNN